MSSSMTIGQVLAANNLCEYENELLNRYFEIVFNEGKPDKQLATEMFQIFDSLLCVRFGDVVFVRQGV